jgi:ubiquinol-cytochrome c reductase cytochrome c1 subunit
MVVLAIIIFFLSAHFCNYSYAHADLPSVHVNWSFQSLFGTFKRDQLQRGYQVYKEVCSACHGMKRVAYRNLRSLGFSEGEIKALAADYKVTDGPNNEGQMFERSALPKDHFVSPFANDNAARAANNGALPPDLSLIVKAREGGVNYIYGLLTGYQTPPSGFQIDAGKHYNVAFPGHLISMAQPLHDGHVTYSDGTHSTIDQMAQDVITFLAWASEPELEERKQLGFKVLLYLAFMTSLFCVAMRRVWSKIK